MLLEKFGQKFTDEFGADPRKYPKCRLRMLDTIEKCRKILSANSETTVNIECLLEDEDLVANMKRSDFEEMIAPLLSNFENCLKGCLEASGIKKEDIHSIEMVGEGTRIPIIQETSKSVFGQDRVCRTLNSSEAVARGCAL